MNLYPAGLENVVGKNVRGFIINARQRKENSAQPDVPMLLIKPYFRQNRNGVNELNYHVGGYFGNWPALANLTVNQPPFFWSLKNASSTSITTPVMVVLFAAA